MNKNDIEFLQVELIRVSDWIKFADQKVAILSWFFTLIIGFILSNKNFNDIFCVWYKLLIAILLFISIIIWFFFILKVIFPKLKNKNTSESCFYYWNIASKKSIDFIKIMKKLTDKDILEQLIEQIHTNSTIADIKMKNFKIATIFLFISLILTIIFHLI